MTAYDDPLLGMTLPRDEPGPTAQLAADLSDLADRLGVHGARVAAMGGVDAWSGVASAAAEQRLQLCALVLRLERSRLVRAAEALRTFSSRVALARIAADEARHLMATARAAQAAADRSDPAEARTRDATAIGHRLDGSIYAPEAVRLLDRAREQALTARTGYDDAAASLAAELTALSGRRVLRHAGDGRLMLDLLGFVPVVGTVVDVVDVLTYASVGSWDDAAVTVVSAVPGPVGWTVTAAGLASSFAQMGEVAGTVRTAPAVPVVPLPRVVSGAAPVPARGPRRRRQSPTSPQPP
jgi:hypothetical protein